VETLRHYLLRNRKEIELKSPGNIEIFNERSGLASPGMIVEYENFKEIVACFVNRGNSWRYLSKSVLKVEWKKGIRFFHNHRFISEFYRCKILLGRWPLGEATSVITRWNKYVKLIKGEDVR